LASNEDNDHPADPAHEGGAFLLEGPLTEADARHREREKKDDQYKSRQLLFNCLLVVVGSLTVGVYAYQAHIMNGSLEEAKTSADAATSAAETADATLKAMTTSTVETSAQIERLIAQQQRTADSMEQNLARSKEALDASINQNHLDQRAWLGFQESTDIVVKLDSPGSVTHWFINTGKTPATDVKARGSTATLAPSATFRPVYADVSSIYSTTPIGVNIVMPNQRIWLKNSSLGSFTQPAISALQNKEGLLYVFGEACYADIFKQRHHVTFCELLMPDLKTLIACNTYNQTDDDTYDHCDWK
jgi:hypothetical protein